MIVELESSWFPHFRQRRLAILQDDSSQLRRAVLAAPAEDISPDEINFIISHTGGLLFVALSPERAESFGLDLMSRPLLAPLQQDKPVGHLDAFVSVDAREEIASGISTFDRAKTVSLLGALDPRPRQLVKPGHIFPVSTRAGGTLVVNALPEGALDLTKLAGFTDAALLVDLLDESGNFLAPEDQVAFAAKHDLSLITLGDLIRKRLASENIVDRVAEAKLPSRYGGELRSYIYKSRLHSGEHMALVKGQPAAEITVRTRVQTESTFSDVFGGPKPPTRHLIQASLNSIRNAPTGVLVYLRQSSGGHLQKQVQGSKSIETSLPPTLIREYGVGAQILYDLGVRKIELLTNNQQSLVGLRAFGLEITAQRKIPFK